MEVFQYFKFKLQTVSIEFFISLSFFFFIILILTIIQMKKINELTIFYEDLTMIRDLNSLDIVFDIEGKPKDWNCSNFEVIGLRKEGKIDINKIENFKRIDYKKSKEILMIRNEFCILEFNIGNCSFENSKKIFVLEKIVPVKFNDSTILQKVKIVIWN